MNKLKVMLCVFALAGVVTGCGNAATSIQDTTASKEEQVSAEANSFYETGREFLYGLNGKEISYADAYENFEKALELGKVEANFYMGAMHDWYSYPTQDFEMARNYYEACGENPYAQISLGYMYYNGQGVDADKEKGKQLFETAVANGCVEANVGLATVARDAEDYETAIAYCNQALEGTEQLYTGCAANELGYMYGGNISSIEADYAKAVEYYEKGARLGYVSSIYNMGVMYKNGFGVEQDYAKAIEYYERAMNLGYGSSAGALGWLYQEGIGVEQNYAKAIEYYEKGAALENGLSAHQLGYMYQEGIGVEQNYAKAVEYYEKGIELGMVNSANNLAFMYRDGIGVEQSDAKTIECFEKGVSMGDAGCAYNLAMTYQHYVFDNLKAVEAYEKAIELGHAVAPYNLGEIYYYGWGVEKDEVKAQELYDLAVSRGCPNAEPYGY